MVREAPQGGLALHYDPAIAVPFRALTPEAALTAKDEPRRAYRTFCPRNARCAGHAAKRAGDIVGLPSTKEKHP